MLQLPRLDTNRELGAESVGISPPYPVDGPLDCVSRVGVRLPTRFWLRKQHYAGNVVPVGVNKKLKGAFLSHMHIFISLLKDVSNLIMI